MCIRDRLGLLAYIALMLYVAMFIWSMSLFNVVLTLPGIAALIPVSYKHLDVYKRQDIEKFRLRETDYDKLIEIYTKLADSCNPRCLHKRSENTAAGFSAFITEPSITAFANNHLIPEYSQQANMCRNPFTGRNG